MIVKLPDNVGKGTEGSLPMAVKFVALKSALVQPRHEDLRGLSTQRFAKFLGEWGRDRHG